MDMINKVNPDGKIESDVEMTVDHFEKIELEDCNVPVGCPWGADCPDDSFPNHH